MHVIVHIGPPKTGSSAIQGSLSKNSEQLADQGYLTYRGSKLKARALSSWFIGKNTKLNPAMRAHFSSIAEMKKWSEKSWFEFESRVQKEKPRAAIISSEHFSDINKLPVFIKRLGQTFSDIRIISYVRDPVDLYLSVVNQVIRGGARFADLKTPQTFKYPSQKRISRYVNLLGQEKVTVRNFDRANLAGGDVIEDFFDVISKIEESEIRVADKSFVKNQSLSAAATVWLMTLNETFDRYGKSDDKAVLQSRRDLLKRLKASEPLKLLPKLKLSDPWMQSVIRYNARDTVDWFNSKALQGQKPLETIARTAPAPDTQGVQEQMRDWMFSYLTPENTETLLREIVLLSDESPDQI